MVDLRAICKENERKKEAAIQKMALCQKIKSISCCSLLGFFDEELF
jgi:hypothetical protein